MESLLELLPLLALAIGMYVVLGIFKNMAIKRQRFEPAIFGRGVVKALLFLGCVIGLTFIVDNTHIIDESLRPELLLQGALIYYVGKVFYQLKEILMPSKGITREEVREVVKQEVGFYTSVPPEDSKAKGTMITEKHSDG
jgi:predicted membrane channel-forming protein YqfA (hemolysin III family)